jgi:hypothetical protein
MTRSLLILVVLAASPLAGDEPKKPAAPAPESQGAAAAGSAKRAEEWTKRIDSLASKNTAPRLTRNNVIYEPSFPHDYDWKDQERVLEALNALAQCSDPELWDILIAHGDDQRYSFTARRFGPNAYNFSVGSACRMLAGEQLLWIGRMNSDPDSRGRPDVIVNLGLRDLDKWRSERREKALWELQVELLDKAALEVGKLERLSDDQKKALIAQIERGKDGISRSRKAIFIRVHLDSFDFYSKASQK